MRLRLLYHSLVSIWQRLLLLVLVLDPLHGVFNSFRSRTGLGSFRQLSIRYIFCLAVRILTNYNRLLSRTSAIKSILTTLTLLFLMPELFLRLRLVLLNNIFLTLYLNRMRLLGLILLDFCSLAVFLCIRFTTTGNSNQRKLTLLRQTSLARIVCNYRLLNFYT